MQYFMVVAVLEGNYGGVVDMVNLSIFKAFKRYFWLDISIHWSQEFDMLWKASTWGKFEISGYAPSPL